MVEKVTVKHKNMQTFFYIYLSNKLIQINFGSGYEVIITK